MAGGASRSAGKVSGGGHVGTAYVTILPNMDRFATDLAAQMRTVNVATGDAGDTARESASSWDATTDSITKAGTSATLAARGFDKSADSITNAGAGALSASDSFNASGDAIQSAGQSALFSSGDFDKSRDAIDSSGQSALFAGNNYQKLGGDIHVAQVAVDHFNDSVKRGGGAFFGGPVGTGVATDVGAAFRNASNIAQGFIGVITLIAPTINIIIAGLVGMVALLTAGVVAAGALLVAIGATAAAMALAAVKWRNLLTESAQGAETWRGALLAVEAQAFNMSQTLIESFSTAGKASADFWQSIGSLGVRALQAMEPIIQNIADHVMNFVDALSGVKGASSPFLDFLRTWIEEWKVLGQIINQGIEGGGGLLGFFEKYEAPAKAFVEGIAQVINGIRKMSAMGLGLNMDQLAELIRNVFTALAQLVQVFPKFSNALVSVGLEVTRFIMAMMPIISAAFAIGSAILQNIVAPIVNGVLVAFEKLMSIPILRWLIELGGGWAIAAFGISKLSFGLLTFGKLVSGAALVSLVKFIQTIIQLGGVMNTVAAYSPNLVAGLMRIGGALQGIGSFVSGGALSGLQAGLLGAGVAIGVVVVASIAIDHAMSEFAKTEAEVARQTEEVMQQMASGAISIDQTRQAIYDLNQEARQTEGIWSKMGRALSDPFSEEGAFKLSRYVSSIATLGASNLLKPWQDSVSKSIEQSADWATADEELLASISEMGANMQQGVIDTGALTDTQVNYVDVLNQTAAGQEQLALTAKVAYDALNAGQITAGQYAQIMTDLGVSVDGAGELIDLTALKIEGASNTIAESMKEIEKGTFEAGKGLETFAYASGQSLSQLKTDASEAILDPVGGLLGSGAKLTEFFQQQMATIEQWKETTADAFNSVRSNFLALAGTGDLTMGDIISSLRQGLGALVKYSDQWKHLAKMGYTKQVLADVVAAGPEGANLVAGMTTATKAQVQEMNKLEKQGVTISSGLAADMAAAIGLAMDKVVNSVLFLSHVLLHIPFDKVKERFDKLMGDVGGKKKGVEVPVKAAVDQKSFEKAKKLRDDAGTAIKVPVKVEPDFGGSDTAVTNLHERAASQMAKPLPVNFDYGDQDTAIGRIYNHAQTILAPGFDVPLKVNDEIALTAIDTVNSEYSKIGTPVVPVGLNTNPALSDIANVQGNYSDIGIPPVPIDVNTGPADQAIAHVKGGLQNIPDEVVNIIVKREGRAITGMTGGVVTVGGIIPGFAIGGSTDTIPAMLSPGEFVFKKSAVDRIGVPSLMRMNQGGSVQAPPRNDGDDLADAVRTGMSGLSVQIVDSNLGLVMDGVIDVRDAHNARMGRQHR